MRRDLRPKSARTSTHSSPKDQRIQSNNFFSETPAMSIKVSSARDPQQTKQLSSSSKLLQKFDHIKAYRSTKNSLAEDDFYQEDFFPIAEKKKLMKKTAVNKRKASDHLVK